MSTQPAEPLPTEDTGQEQDAANKPFAVGDAPSQEKNETFELVQKLAQYEEQVTTLKDQLLRSIAETENLRKRFQRDQEDTSKYAVTGFARDLVNVIENLHRASATIPENMRASNETLKTIGDGVDMTMRELLGVMEKHGIRRIDPTGLKFDHNFHQAIAQVEKADVPPGMVVQVVQAGYVIHDRLLRPAMVAVSKAAEPPVQHVDTQA